MSPGVGSGRTGFLNATADLAAYSDYLEHNELQLAADELHDAADERGDLPKAFWQALLSAFESMKLDEDVRRCRVRIAKLE